MRSLLCAMSCALVLGCSLFAQEATPDAATAKGSFYVDGIVYQFASNANYTVVAAAHSAINHKFVAVKVRVYNTGQRSVTVKPEDISMADAVNSQTIMAISGADLAQKMRKPYNMARYAVNGIAGPEEQVPITSDMLNPQFLQMMRAMAAAHTSGAGMVPSANNLLYTDTPGALEETAAGPAAAPAECDQVCRLHNREAQGVDALAQLQHQNSPDYIENAALRANTIPPRGNAVGVLYFPLGKLAATSDGAGHGKKSRTLRLTVPVMDETFRFELPVE